MSNILTSNKQASNITNVPIDACPKCSRQLTGVIEISEGNIAGLSVVVMRETADRNWIACDSCNQTICKACCAVPDSGCCDSCFVKYKIEPRLPAVYR